jgi:hypothetical protein
MSQQQLLVRVAATLKSLRIPAMLTGSVASGLQGQPRSTHDIDIVVEISEAQVGPLVAAFPPPRYYLDEHAIRQALASGEHFNLLDTQTGDKVDFWLLTDDPFDVERFARRQSVGYHGATLEISTPEDTILKKLDWARQLGVSEKQLADVRAVAQFQRGRLDETYLDRWAARLGVTDLWRQVRGGP